MQHFPIFLSLADRKVVLSGGGQAALAKLRLLLKTPAKIHVFSPDPAPEIFAWAKDTKIILVQRALQQGDVSGAALFYAADENPLEDARTTAIARAEGALVNVVDNLTASDFITPAIVDRDPVTIAIGTEGAAPVLARAIKSDLEQRLPVNLGLLARIGKAFRPMAELLPMGRRRREFWADFYFAKGPQAFDKDGQRGVQSALDNLLNDHLRARNTTGFVDFVGAGPGDPELLTLKARNALDRADVIFHEPDVSPKILELVRREARIVELGNQDAFTNPATNTAELIIAQAKAGAHVVRLISGAAIPDTRVISETGSLDAVSIDWHLIPGVATPPTRALHPAYNHIGRKLPTKPAGYAAGGLPGNMPVKPIYVGATPNLQIFHKGISL